jgi:ABC-type spermidine/putrescine transport system permease subunit II
MSGGIPAQILSGSGIWGDFWSGVILSYSIALLVTAINLLFSFPMAILIARKRFGKSVSAILDSLSSVPIVIPSVALGVSMMFFWRNFAIPEFWLIVLSHLSITYPYLVATLVSALDDIPTHLEETARTLGADPFTSFSTITLPLARYSLLSGAILTFTRSVDETGATLAVSSTLRTVPVLLVNWAKNPFPGSELAVGIGTSILLLTSVAILLILKTLSRGKRLA